MDRFTEMQCFARAVETGSFSAVARELGIGQPNVSRYIASLEKRLGVRLLYRSTRRLALTGEGEGFYAETRRVLDALGEAESTARGTEVPSGLLRAACPTALGRPFVLPLIKALRARYPALEVDLQIGDRFIDLVEEGVDVAIRIGDLKDSNLRARPLGVAERICVASPGYLARHGTPCVPDELRNHDCILYTLSRSADTWQFRDGSIAVKGTFRVNTPDGIYQAAVDGLGIVYAPVWLFDEDLMSGRLQAVLTPHLGPTMPISAVYSARRLLSRRATAFMDFVAADFARQISLNAGSVRSILEGSAR